MHETPDPQQARLPGVRYRTETRWRPVKVNVFGEEHDDQEPYVVDVPLPPRDWDRLLLRFLLAVAIGSTTVAIVWSTASISRLLSLVVTTTGIAVAAAALFELLWIVCLVAERLLRGQPDRARPMQTAGWLAVTAVVAAVVVEGIHEGGVAAGIVGGAVSLMAKGSWWVVFRVQQVKLRRPIANALQRKLEDLAATEALLSYRQRIGGREEYAALVFGHEQLQAAQRTVHAAHQLDTARTASPTPQPVVPGQPSATVSPQATPPTAPVAPPVSAPSQDTADTAAPIASGQGEQDEPPLEVRPITLPSIAAVCRQEIGRDQDVTDAAIVKAVLAAGHPETTQLADTVRRTAARVDPTRKARRIS